MTARERLTVLREVGELSDAPDSALRSLLSFFDEVVVPAGVVLAREGRLGHELFVVAEGDLEVCRQGRKSRLGPGESFGWSAMRHRAVHDATAVTVTPARLLVMGHAQFRAVEGLDGWTLASGRSVSSLQDQIPNTAHNRRVGAA